MFGHLDCDFGNDPFDSVVQCSLCRALGKEYGLTARLLTNYDTSFFLALPFVMERERLPVGSSRCPLLMKIRSAAPGHPLLRFYAGVTVVLLDEKIRDDLADGDRLYPSLFLKWAARKRRLAERALGGLGFEPRRLTEMFLRHRELEKAGCGDLGAITRPTAEALSEIYGFACGLTGMQEHQEPFMGIGAAMGEIIYLMDSISDYTQDLRLGTFNPLLLCRPAGPGAADAGQGRISSEVSDRLFQAGRVILDELGKLPADPYIQDLYGRRLTERLNAFGDEARHLARHGSTSSCVRPALTTPVGVLLSASTAMASSSQGSGGGSNMLLACALLAAGPYCAYKAICGQRGPDKVTVDHGCGGTKTYRRDSCSGKYRDDSCC